MGFKIWAEVYFQHPREYGNIPQAGHFGGFEVGISMLNWDKRLSVLGWESNPKSTACHTVVVPISREMSEIFSWEISYHFPGIPRKSYLIFIRTPTLMHYFFFNLFLLGQRTCISKLWWEGIYIRYTHTLLFFSKYLTIPTVNPIWFSYPY